MNIQEAIKTGKPLRRESWVNKEFRDFHEWTINKLDILAGDWEVEPEKIQDRIVLEDNYGDSVEMFCSIDRFYLFCKHSLSEEMLDYSFNEEEVDKLLTFLYNNTKVGKSRVIPF